MKTTLDLDDRLVANAKVLAVQQRTSLTRLVEEGLQWRLRAPAAPAEAVLRQPLPVFRGGNGLVNGVNPCSNQSMRNALGDDA